jgi:uncharacterized protein
LARTLHYRVIPQRLAVCRFPADASLPAWAASEAFLSVTRTLAELSVVCDEARVPDGVQADKGWIALQLAGPFPFSMTGVLASFIQPLAEANIPVFAMSTFDTDYVLIKQDHLAAAEAALQVAGHHRAE